MKLKEYQQAILDGGTDKAGTFHVGLSPYLRTLAEKRREAEEFVEFQRSKGRDAKLSDFCRDAWAQLSEVGTLPKVRHADGTESSPGWVSRVDGRGRPIPNVCLKLPTGGGKTLLATIAVDRINVEYFRCQTGLVLWVVPSEAIYSQTWRTLANREHPYRQMLERASGGRVKLLEKGDRFTKQDVESYLCVMLIMLQAGAVRRETKEARKMFQDSGKYPSFFPDVDDFTGMQAMLSEHPDLELNDVSGEGLAVGALSIRQSLANVLRVVRPIVVIDEGHKAYSETALNFIAEHNPRFILELSATPNARDHVSNVLVNVSGTALKNEEMIKLPINLINEGRADWKHALAAGKEKLDELKKVSRRVQNNEDRYIRPIMLVRVERTGDDQRDKEETHAEDVRTYLIEKLGVDRDEIKVKSSSKDELSEVDTNPAYEGKGLLSDKCPVRFIITKDALREGWDCPFAYVLVVLSRTTARTALTQMIGRVLRQPHAKLTQQDALNECYVFTHNQDVQAAVERVREGLSEEGMGDLAASVRASGGGAPPTTRKETLKRRNAFKGLKVFMPRVLSRHYKTGELRDFDYERDLMPRIAWDTLDFAGKETFEPDAREGIDRSIVRIDIEPNEEPEERDFSRGASERVIGTLEVGTLARLLLDVVPNPWQGVRIVEAAIASMRARGFSEQRIFANRLFLIQEIKADLRKQVLALGERVFREMLEAEEITFQLVSAGDPRLNWELANTLEIEVTAGDKVFTRENGAPIEKSFLEPVYERQLNGLERNVAHYLDGHAAVKWWHRIAVKQDWSLQGWQRSKVYPDFLACIHGGDAGVLKFTILETKGLHLAGNEDTAYKRRLFEVLSAHTPRSVPAGELVLEGSKEQLRFDILISDNWRQTIPATLA